MQDKTSLILVVDDELEMQRLLRQRFRRRIRSGDLSFQFAQNGVEALQILQDPNTEIDMVLTDIRMPEMDGLTLLANLGEFEPPLKAVVISAFGDMQNIRTAMNRGAFDFLTKPIDFEDLEITIDKTLAFVSLLREKQQQLQEALDRLHNLVFYDQLTGLPNQNNLLQKITQCFELKRTQGNEFALLILDVERHAIIKSGFGHGVSDQLLVEMARRLAQLEDSSTFSARIGDNVFALLWHSLDSLNNMQDHVGQLLHLLAQPFQLAAMTVTSATRMGVALSELPLTQPAAFLQAADTALQIARQQNSRELVFFDIQMQETAAQRLNLEVELQRAIETGQLSLHYQPIFRLATQEIVGFEALVRWQNPSQGPVSPLKFIPLAEETGLIVPLGEWILSVACQQLGQWQAQFGASGPSVISVNLSSLQLQSPTLLRSIDESLSTAGLTGHALRLEITESVLMENIKDAIGLLSQLRERNIQLSIDDFGTGYSSLSYLQLLPIDTLKIDGSFIQDIETNPTNLDITSTIINLAGQLGLDVVAEGLEKQEHIDILESLSCCYGQGFVFSPPLPVAEATALIAQRANPSP